MRLATLSAALLGCGTLLMTGARGEEAIPPESCEATDYSCSSFPEDEVCGENESSKHRAAERDSPAAVCYVDYVCRCCARDVSQPYRFGLSTPGAWFRG